VPPGILAALAVLAALFAARGSASATKQVPALVGKSEADAKRLAVDASFTVTTRTVPHDGKAGMVVGQQPAAGRLRPARSTVTLQIAEGSPQATVPNVAGKPLDEATEMLSDAKLAVGDVAYVPATGANAGTVVKTIPSASATIDEGTAVTLIVAAPASTANGESTPEHGKRRGKND
jgi:serine/threonine-protein kinase